MLNNFIKIYDFIRVVEKIRQGELTKIAARVLPLKQNSKIINAWKHNETPPRNWWDIPQVLERWNYLVTANTSLDIYNYTAQKYFNNKNNLNAFSL